MDAGLNQCLARQARTDDITALRLKEATLNWVSGVDGCPAGWIVVLAPTNKDTEHRTVLCHTFEEILCLQPSPDIIVIDIPIGLLDVYVPGGRDCDCEARKLLGQPRSSSVFSAPSRTSLGAQTYDEARRHHMSQQAFGILPKVGAVDDAMTPTLQDRVFESHPEVAFWSLAGRPMTNAKKRSAGREERLSVLEEAEECRPLLPRIRESFDKDRKKFSRKEVGLDDIIDAYVMAWVAWRIATGASVTLPEIPPKDSRGLRMEIWR